MTMLDDDRLAALLSDVAATFEVPATGPDEILARAAGRGPSGDDGDADRGRDAGTAAPPAGDLAPRGRIRRLTAVAGRHRALSVAAGLVVVLVLAGTLGALTRGPARPMVTAGLLHRASTPATAPSSTTTTPSPAAGVFQPAGNGAASDGARAPATEPQSKSTTTPTTAAPLPSSAVGQNAKIEQTGSLALTVGRGKLGPTVNQLTALAGANGGFVANSQTQSGAATGTTPSGSVTLQVPVQSFGAVLRSAQALGKTSDLTTKATDVTGQYVDLQSRIIALQASRQQYLTILAKATSVGDVLAVQEQLDGLQSQIEQLQGQLQLLTSQTSYSTLTVTVSEGAPKPRPSAVPESGLVRAWHTSIGGFVSGVEGLIRVAGPLLFALLLVGAVLVGGRAGWRRYQRHNL